MVKRKSKGSLLGSSSSGSKDKTGLYLVSIVAIVAVVALFLMVKGGSSEVSGETVMVADEEGNIVGEAFYDKHLSKSRDIENKKIKEYNAWNDKDISRSDNDCDCVGILENCLEDCFKAHVVGCSSDAECIHLAY